MRKRFSAANYFEGIRAGDRIVLSQAITLIESRLHSDRILSDSILEKVMPYAGNALRIGITGPPGVGKSTFIEALGQYLTQLDKRVAVLAVDPSSPRSGGSILGDKTRMEKLSHNPNAFIRPSATGSSVGGVARHTRETMLLCEAAGYDIVLIETVGVGQSETMVKEMTDFFLMLTIPGAGDQLQGIKKGIMEMVDAVVINKSDGNNRQAAQTSLADYQNILHMLAAPESGVPAGAFVCSAAENTGLPEIWTFIEEYFENVQENGFFKRNRQSQNVDWLYNHIAYLLEDRFLENVLVRKMIPDAERAVKEGQEHPSLAARTLVDLFLKN